MLLTVYGMRRSEVAGLKLPDIDWINEQIYLRRAKRSKPQVFPLSKTVGEAILRYLKDVRPKHCKLKHLFIGQRSPYQALSAGAIYAIVNRRLKPLNLPIKNHGPHALRHACATHLINEGFSLKEISDHLGHQELETTRIYAKVDLKNIRKVAEQKWEGLL
jgi:integrase/recombinase XerD